MFVILQPSYNDKTNKDDKQLQQNGGEFCKSQSTFEITQIIQVYK